MCQISRRTLAIVRLLTAVTFDVCDDSHAQADKTARAAVSKRSFWIGRMGPVEPWVILCSAEHVEPLRWRGGIAGIPELAIRKTALHPSADQCVSKSQKTCSWELD